MSRSTMVPRSAISGSLSRDHLHPEAVLLAGCGGVFNRKHGFERGDRNRELVQRGVSGGQLLELEARPDQGANPALCAVAARPPYDLVRETRNQYDADHP